MGNTSNSLDKSIEYSETAKEKLFQNNIKKINNNYPLLNISRLEKGDININISFDNLKFVNKKYSKEEADIGINIIKEFFNNFFENNEEGKANRTVKETYKSKLFGLKEENLDDMIELIRDEIPEKINIDEDESKTIVFNTLIKETYSEEEIRKKAKEKINIFFENNDKYIEKNNLKKENIEEIIDILGVNISVKENKAETFKEKLLHIYEIEFDSYINSSVLKEALSDDEKLLNNLKNKDTKLLIKAKLVAKKVKKIEKKIEKELKKKDKNFSFIKKPEIFFNSLEIVKKGNSTGNKNVDKLFEQYKSVISTFDIISPITGEVNYYNLEKQTKEKDKTVDEYRKLAKDEDEAIDNNNDKQEEYSKLEKLIQTNYKGTLTRGQLNQEVVSYGKGTLMFIDIAGMGMCNIEENRRNIVEIFLKEDITKEEKEKKLLEAGLEMTKKVTKVMEELVELGVKISREGDEIFIFIPEEKEEEINKEKITEIFSENKLKARSTYLELDGKNELQKEEVFGYFDKLDHISGINKKIENAGKFYISKKEEKNKGYLENTKENYKINVKNILKENNYLKEKEGKIINFFEVNKEDLIFTKEEIIENFRGKITYSLEKSHIEILNNQKRKFLKENLTKAGQIKFDSLVNVLGENKENLFSFIDVLGNNGIINFSKFINNLQRVGPTNPIYNLLNFFKKIDNSGKQKFAEILEIFDDKKIENFTNFFNSFGDNGDDLAELYSLFDELKQIKEKFISSFGENKEDSRNRFMNQIDLFSEIKKDLLEVKKYKYFRRYILELEKIYSDKNIKEEDYNKQMAKLTENIYKLKIPFNDLEYSNFTIEDIIKTKEYLTENGYFK